MNARDGFGEGFRMRAYLGLAQEKRRVRRDHRLGVAHLHARLHKVDVSADLEVL